MVARCDHRGPFHRGQIEIAFPQANVGANLSALLATALTEKPGQSVIVKKPGADTTTAAAAVAKLQSDGFNLLLASSYMLTLNPVIRQTQGP